jgi:hypothetical protein
VGPGDHAEFLGPDDAGEAHAIRDGVSVDSLRARIFQIAEPLNLRRHIREALELGGARRDFGRELGIGRGVGMVRFYY